MYLWQANTRYTGAWSNDFKVSVMCMCVFEKITVRVGTTWVACGTTHSPKGTLAHFTHQSVLKTLSCRISVKLLSISPFSPDAARTTPFVTTCGSTLPPTSTPIDKQIGESMNTFITNSAFVSTSSAGVTPGYSFSIASAKVQTNPATDGNALIMCGEG